MTLFDFDMKFVHLTPQPLISKVKKNGIRCGNGLRGRGVYAVPLMLIPCILFEDQKNPDRTVSMSSINLWLKTLQRHHRHLAAVIFKTRKEQWPADLWVVANRAITSDSILDNLKAYAEIDEEDEDYVRENHNEGWGSDLRLQIHTPNDLGKVMNLIINAGQKTLTRYAESVEMVFPYPIKPNQIEKTIPCYPSNKDFKQRRRKNFD